MTVTLFYLTGGSARIEHVKALRIVSRNVVELQTFGNEPAINRDIERFVVDQFVFANA